jgi:ProP effector
MGKQPVTEDVTKIISLLAERFPKCFVVYQWRRRPLKLGIHKDILAVLDIAPADLSFALRFYCGNEGYLRNSLKGAWRVDLDGNVTGIVTAEEEATAKQRLASARAKKKARMEAKAKEAKATAEAAKPKRLSLTDLKAAAVARRAANAQHSHSLEDVT